MRPLPGRRDGLPVAAAGEDGDNTDLSNWSSLIGIVIAIVGNMLIALALNVQRYAHTRLHRERERNRERARLALLAKQRRGADGTATGPVGHYGTLRNGTDSYDHAYAGRMDEGPAPDRPVEGSPDGHADDAHAASTYLKSPYWWLGQVLITLGEMGNFLAYGFAPASIVSPLGVVALVSNCVIAPILFREKFRQRDFWGVVIAVAGVVTVVLSAKQQETKLGPHEVWDAITTTAFEIYLAVTCSMIAALIWASKKYGKQTILIDLGLVGLFGGYTALATKGVSSMLSSTLWRAFTQPVTYFLVFILLATAVLQVRYVNKALQRFDSTQVIPIQFVMFTLCVITGSAVLYRDFERTTAEQAVKFVCGCLLTFFGVFLITSGRTPREEDEGLSDADGIAETIGLDVGVLDHDSPYQDGADGIPSAASASMLSSRRSSRASRVSFLSSAPRQLSLQHDDGVPSTRMPPQSVPKQSPFSETAPLLASSWPDSTDGQQDLYSQSAPFTDGEPSLAIDVASPSSEVLPPASPRLSGQAGTERPVTPKTTPKRHVLRRTRTFISPSPLSSTVTAVVKDALREPDDHANGMTSLRRIKSSIRASLFLSDGEGPGSSPLFPGDQALASTQSMPYALGDEFHGDEGGTDDADRSPRLRARSLSDTLNDFWSLRSKWKRKKGRERDRSVGSASAASNEFNQV